MKRYQYRTKRFLHNKSLAMGLSVVLSVSLLGGCGNRNASIGEEDSTGGTDKRGGDIQADGMADGKAMGRYLEQVIDLSGNLEGYREKIFTLEDGKLMITQPEGRIQASEDNGASWKNVQLDWLEAVGDYSFIDDYAVGADGTIAIVYSPSADMENAAATGDDSSIESSEDTVKDRSDDVKSGGQTGDNGDGEGGQTAHSSDEEGSKQEADDGKQEDNDVTEPTDSQEKTETDEETEDENTLEEMDGWMFYTQTQALIVKPDGTQVKVALPGGNDAEHCPRHIWISESGRVFVGTYEAVLYEISEDGTGEVYLTLEDSPQLIQFLGSRMLIDGYSYDSIVIYDMDAEEYMEDEVLSDFVQENYGDRDFGGGSWYTMYFFPGEEDVLYLAGKKGVHRHVIGGSAMEQVVDASLSTFGNPSYNMLGMVRLDNNEFIALFTNARLVHLVYDPDVPTVPDERIKAYSLTDNTMLRRAIAIYQTRHPEAYVEYEVGIEDNAITREDALKKLNTEIMAGEGPDLLILDDMPVDSYIEKGLLKDLTPFVDGLEGDGELYDNIVDAFRKEGGLYAIPCEVGLPTVMGKEKYVSKMKDLKGIADVMEELRQDNPGKDLLKICSPKALMKNFITSCAPAWSRQDGSIDREALEEFLVQTKRIYEAQMDGLSEEYMVKYEQRQKDNLEYSGMTIDDEPYYMYSMDEFNYLRSDRQILAGILTYPYAYAELFSVQTTKGFEEDVMAPMDGQSDNVFCVQTLAGVSAGASEQNAEHAQGLLGVLLGSEDISSLGFPVNRAAFESGLFPDDYEDYLASGDSYSTFGYLTEDGQMFTWEIYWFDDTWAGMLRSRMETADTPYVVNAMLEEAVFSAGTAYIQGEKSLEEALDDVEKNLAIYMAE